MPTLLQRALKRRTHGTGVFSDGRHRDVIVELKPPNLIYLRLDRHRKGYYLTAEVAYMVALRAEYAAIAKEKERAKKAKKAGKGK